MQNASIPQTTPDHSVRTHHTYGPSSLGYRHTCSGFAKTDGTSEAALQGTKLHEVCDEVVVKFRDLRVANRTAALHLQEAPRSLLDVFYDVLAARPPGEELSEEERHLCLFCLKTIEPHISRPDAQIFTEEQISVYVDDRLVTRGFYDLMILFKGGTVGILYDYKFGFLAVPEAADNYQGLAYAVGVLQRSPRLEKLAVCFPQPRLNAATSHVYTRQAVARVSEIDDIINRAIMVEAQGIDHPDSLPYLQYGPQCAYCAHTSTGKCPVRLKNLGVMARSAPVPVATSFDISKINSPEEAALARYWVETVEDFMEGVKTRVKEVAIVNGGSVEITLPDGQLVRYRVFEKSVPRVLGSTPDVLEATKEILTKEEVLAIAKIPLEKLVEIGRNVLYERANSGAQAELDALALDVSAGRVTEKEAKARKKEIKAKYSETTLTKDAAEEQFCSLLEVQGALSKPDTKISVLSRDKNAGKTQKTLKQ